MAASKDSDRAAWDADKDEFLVISLQELADEGKRADSGFKREALKHITMQFNERFQVNYLMSQLKSRLDTLKKDYKDFKFLKENSGFGWNDEVEIPTAPDDVWKAVIEASTPNSKSINMDKTSSNELDASFGRSPQSITKRKNEVDTTMNESSCSDDSDAVPPVSLRSKKKRKTQRDQRPAGAVIGNAVAKLVEVEIAKLKTMSTTKSDATQFNSRLEQALDSFSLNYEHLSASDIATMADIIGVGHNTVATRLQVLSILPAFYDFP
ncbi:hypothetical protein AC1031_004643 [Aphanomyces cochlioides]|nr:hypothetical protein AC1031_004643 [Aphanomyces cochlioides]